MTVSSMKWAVVGFVFAVGVGGVRGDALPGFRAELLGSAAGFVSSVAVDGRGTIYYTTTSGGVFRVGGGEVAHVTTDAIGNSGLLGMALMDDRTAVVHYTTPNQTDDVIAKLDLLTGEETIVHKFVCDISLPGREGPSEHHGGNPHVSADGSIWVAIGDYGGGLIASLPEWNGGKVFRIHPDGAVEQFALGFRNPFDLTYDAANDRVIVADNGPLMNDELNIVTRGGNYGWPFTAGDDPPIAGTVPPVYTFPATVAPTGIVGLSGRNTMLRRGYLLGGFVTKAIYYIPDIDAPAPITLIERDPGFVIDVAEAPNGDIVFATGNAIYRLNVPARGDCNGDGRVNAADVAALTLELADGPAHRMVDAPLGNYAGSWGCDANADSLINAADLTALFRVVGSRTRAVGR